MQFHGFMDLDAAIDVGALRESLGLTQEQFARITGYAVTDLQAWEEGRPINTPAMQRLKEYDRLQKALAGIMAPERVPNWLRTPAEQFRFYKPIELIENGEIDLIWRFIGAAEQASKLSRTE